MPDDSKIQTGAARACGLFTIAAAAAAAGLSSKMLRHYEEQGLLGDVKRSDGGYRIYSDDDIERLKIVASGRAAGFAIEDIRGMLTAAADGQGTHYAQMIADRVAELERLRGLLLAFHLRAAP